MTDVRSILERALADEPEDDLDLRAVVVEGGRRAARRRRRLVAGVVAGTCAAVVAAVVGPALLAGDEEPGPAPSPAPRVERVDLLGVGDARPLPSDPLLSLNDPRGERTSARFEGITDDGLTVRVTHDGLGGTAIGLTDPRTGATDRVPSPGRDVGDLAAVELSTERLAFLDHDDFATRLLVFDRAAGTWTAARLEGLRIGTQRMYVPAVTASVSPDGRLWFQAVPPPSKPHPECGVDDGVECWLQWWSVPYPAGGPVRREPAYDGTDLTWTSTGPVSVDRQAVHVGTDGADRDLPLAAPLGCDPAGVPTVSGEDWFALTVPCGRGGVAVVVYDDQGEARFSLPPGRLWGPVVTGGDHLAVAFRDRGAARGYVVDVTAEEVVAVPVGSRTTMVDVAAGLVAWQDPEESWSRPGGRDYWTAELP